MNMILAAIAGLFLHPLGDYQHAETLQPNLHLADAVVTETDAPSASSALAFALEPEPAPPGERTPAGTMSFGTTVNVQSPQGQRLALSLTQMPVIDVKPGVVTYVSTTTGCRSPSFVADLVAPRIAEAIIKAKDPMSLVADKNRYPKTLAATLCKGQRGMNSGQLFLVSQGKLIGTVDIGMTEGSSSSGKVSIARGYTLDRDALTGVVPTYIQRLWSGPVKRRDSAFNGLLDAASTAEAFHMRAIGGSGDVGLIYERLDPALVDQGLLDLAVAENFAPSLTLKAHIMMRETGLYDAKPSDRRLQRMDQAKVAELEVMVARAASRFLPAQDLVASLRRHGLKVNMDLARGGAPDIAAMTRQRNIENALLRRLNSDGLRRACEDVRARLVSSIRNEAFNIEFRGDKCRVNVLSGAFYADLWFQNVEVFGCNAGTCNYRTVNQCNAKGTVAWGACGEWVDGPWRGEVTVDQDARIIAIK